MNCGISSRAFAARPQGIDITPCAAVTTAAVGESIAFRSIESTDVDEATRIQPFSVDFGPNRTAGWGFGRFQIDRKIGLPAVPDRPYHVRMSRAATAGSDDGRRGRRVPAAGFTLVELLVVIGIIA